MKKISTIKLLATLSILNYYSSTIFGQCTNQVSHLNGNMIINGVNVSVSSSGAVDHNNIYCVSTAPYTIGYYSGTISSGPGSYTFNFSPPITAATFNFSGISSCAAGAEEISIYKNGVHYPIPTIGIYNGCDSLAVLTAYGNITGCLNCDVSGWNQTTITGPITSLSVSDQVFAGSPGGAIFSIFICDIVVSGMDEIENIGSFQLFPNPFNYSATIQTSSYLTYGTLRLYNYLGQLVKQIDRISGQTIILNRDDLPNGVYFLQLIQNNKIFSTKKIVITD